MPDPMKLRELAAWYREFAEGAGSAAIWESRLRMAEDLEAEANRSGGETSRDIFMLNPSSRTAWLWVECG